MKVRDMGNKYDVEVTCILAADTKWGFDEFYVRDDDDNAN